MLTSGTYYQMLITQWKNISDWPETWNVELNNIKKQITIFRRYRFNIETVDPTFFTNMHTFATNSQMVTKLLKMKIFQDDTVTETKTILQERL